AIDIDRSTFFIAAPAQFLEKDPVNRVSASFDYFGFGIYGGEEGQPWPTFVLRGRNVRCDQHTEHDSKLVAATNHSITSSAAASSDCGRVRPSAFTVLAFMMSLKFVGCSTGISAGLTPFSTLTT